MGSIRSIRLAALAALTVSAACGGGATDGGAGGATGPLGPDTVALFCDQLYTSFADRYAACYKAPLAYATHFIDKAKLCALPTKAVAAGKATYDRAAAGRCLDFYATATCSQLRAVREDTIDVPDCRAAVVGTLAVSSTCLSDAECASGICPSDSLTGCTFGCSVGMGAGKGPCWNDRECAAGLYCNWGTVFPYRTCQPQTNRPGDGQSCDGAACLPGYYCTAVTGGVCKKQIDGGACPGTSTAMVPGYGCFSGVTKPLVAMGAPCVRSEECGPGAWCANVCTQLPVVGQQCVLSRGTFECLGGTCTVVSPTLANCVEYYPTSCGSVWDCESNACHDTCKPWCVKP